MDVRSAGFSPFLAQDGLKPALRCAQSLCKPLYALVAASLWRSSGYIMVLFLAGLKSIDPALTEAARVDGANRWQLFRSITMPQLRGVTSVVLSVIVIDALRSFDIVMHLLKVGRITLLSC